MKPTVNNSVFQTKITPIKPLNEEFTLAQCRVMALGKNRNFSHFSKEAVDEALPTLANIPVIAHVFADDEGKLRIGGHDMEIVSEDGAEDELVVMIDSAVLSNVDLRAILDAHVASGKDVTVVTKAGVCDGEKKIDLALKVENGEVADMVVDYVAPAEYVASMDIFVLSKKWLIKSVKEMIARDKFHMDRDLVMGGWNRGLVSVNVYEFDGVAMFNESVEEYFQNSMALIKKDVRADLFGGNHPVYTKVRDRVPTYYGEGCEIENCLIADGCMLEGEVEDSILFREVSIAKGAEVENCILFNDAVVGEGAELKYVILDKNVTVTPGAKLIGTKKSPIIVKRGETV